MQLWKLCVLEEHFKRCHHSRVLLMLSEHHIKFAYTCVCVCVANYSGNLISSKKEIRTIADVLKYQEIKSGRKLTCRLVDMPVLEGNSSQRQSEPLVCSQEDPIADVAPSHLVLCDDRALIHFPNRKCRPCLLEKELH